LSASDAELIARSRSGSEQASRDLVRRYERSVYNLIVRMVRDPAVAEELAQDAFVKAFRALATYDPAQKFSNWLLRIAHNVAVDFLRLRRVETVSLDQPRQDGSDWAVVDPHADDPSNVLERRDLAAALDRALGRLRPEYRRLVVLRYQEDLAYEDIVEITGLPLGTVKSFLHRARAELARLIEEQGWR
jgi:RNA polymerase sigma-70 factor (ECF subfamily)